MSWIAPRRDEVLAEVIAEAERRLDGVLPLEVAGVEQTFKDAATLASALHLRWHATLASQVERALLELPDDPERAVVRAWGRAARDLPGVRLLLDAERERSEGAARTQWERRTARQQQWLAQQAGLVEERRSLDQESVALGAELEAAARLYFDPRRPHRRPSLARRLRAVFGS